MTARSPGGRRNFNPRTPCGVRRYRRFLYEELPKFQSTHPVWGATLFGNLDFFLWDNFNPRTQCGVRPFTVGAALVNW